MLHWHSSFYYTGGSRYLRIKAPLPGVRDRRAARETFVYLHFMTIRKESQMKLYQKRNGNMSNQDWLDLGTLLLKLGYVVSIGKEKQSGSMYRSCLLYTSEGSSTGFGPDSFAAFARLLAHSFSWSVIAKIPPVCYNEGAERPQASALLWPPPVLRVPGAVSLAFCRLLCYSVYRRCTTAGG